MGVGGFLLLASRHTGVMCRESRTAEYRTAHTASEGARTYRRNLASFDGMRYRIQRRVQHLAALDDRHGCHPSYMGCAVGQGEHID